VMDGKCATCRFWHDPQFDYPNRDPRLNYSNGKWTPHSNGRYVGWGSCLLINYEVTGLALIAVLPDEYCEGNTDVYTAPDFGCVHWEAKE
jgi:hypothetical protein